MKHKVKSPLVENTVVKKKHTKLHEPIYRKQDLVFGMPGLLVDKLGNMLKIRDLVEVNINGKFIECEIVEVRENNNLTVIFDDPTTNKPIETYYISAENVILLK